MKFSPGMHVAPRLRLVRRLGEGGMGEVWVAEELDTGEQLAVKVMMSGDDARDEKVVARFDREARLVTSMKSDHVVRVRQVATSETGLPFIAMELLEGETLGERIRRGEQLDLEASVKLVEQAAEALEEAHRFGVVHRDIKPDNLFLVEGDDLFVKLLDFGIAKGPSQTKITATGTMIGSPRYMSPEQLRNAKHVDGRADLWSLSVVAYYALMGSVPFRGDGLGEVIISIGMSDFTPPTETRPELPAALDAFFSQAFAPDMDDRFQNATALARAFRGASAIDEKAKPKSRKTATGTEFLLGKKTVPLTKAQIDAYLANHDATLAVVAPPPPPEEEPTSEPPSADVAEPIEIPMEASRHRRIGLALIGGIAAGGIALFGVRAMTTSERVETAASKLVPTVVATVPTASASAPPPAPPPKPTASAVVRPAASTKPPPVKPRPVKPRYPRDLLDSRD